MKNVKIVMPYEVKLALNILNENNFDAYIVGGCVRDSILGIEPEDWDITTSAIPSQIIECFKNYKIIETGLKHGTVTVIINKISLEITTYRIDGEYKDNRRPNSVEFTNNIELDLERRDFTINAMAYNDKSGLLDFFRGTTDIELKEIKCVGNPDNRFKEDGLRILRALRFASVLGFEIEINTSNSIHKNKELLKNISAERLATEFNKLITGMNFIKILSEYCDVISVFIPELIYIVEFNHRNDFYGNNLWQNTLASMANVPNDLTLRLAMLFHDIGKQESMADDKINKRTFTSYSKISSEIASNVLCRLKYDKSTTEMVKTLILYHDEEIQPTMKNVKRWLNKLGESILKKLLEVKKANIKSKKHIYEEDRLNIINQVEFILGEILSKNLCFALKDLAVNGEDLINIGINKGKKIGEILNELLSMVIDEELENEREKLLYYVKTEIL